MTIASIDDKKRSLVLVINFSLQGGQLALRPLTTTTAATFDDDNSIHQ